MNNGGERSRIKKKTLRNTSEDQRKINDRKKEKKFKENRKN